MDNTKHFFDSMALVVSALSGLLPSIAVALSIVWTVLRIYETVTVQGWLGRDRRKTPRDKRGIK